LKTFGGRLLAGAAVGAIVAGGAAAQSIDDTIVVTAQRQEQSLQDVPIAVSAFGGQDLQNRQLEGFQDIQFNVPNFNFSKSQFTGSTIVLRGIGALAVGASTEPSVSIHINDTYIVAPRLFETEFFDIERLEVLRGPQGTLFGRNATGGVINVITRKASTDGVEGYVDAEYGNYNAVKVQGALNVPVISDLLAARLAGTIIQRDGYTENLFDGTDIDDRDIYALRGAVRFLPTDNTTIDFTASYMRESDSRLRSQKQACEEGPLSPLLGCDPNGPRSFGRQDLRGGFFANTSPQAIGAVAQSLGFPAATAAAIGAAYGIPNANLAGGPIFGATQPTDLRQVLHDTAPQYDAEETIFMVNAKHDFENFSVRFNGNWGNSKISSRQDFDAGVGPTLLRSPAICGAGGPLGPLTAVCNLTGGAAGPVSFPLSQFDVGITNSNGLVGVIGGLTQDRSANYRAVDLSIGETDYWSVEGIVNTDFDGRINFLFGANHTESNGYADYAVATTGLDYFAYTAGTIAAIGAMVPGAAATGFSFYTPYFWNDTDDSFLESTSVFGEVYFDITDSLKLTGGVRHNWDTKGVRDRGNLLESAGTAVAGVPAALSPIVPFGTPSVRALLDANELVQCPSLEVFCATGGRNDFRVVEGDFDATTGRAVLQWTPTDNVQVYASWTRGFKPGGFNPRTLTALNIPLTFDPEIIKAYEAGIKSNLFSGVLQANLTGFYYDYSGLQISRIFANTSINENIDATVWGLEGEFVLRPTDRLIVNMNAAYLSTKAKNFTTIDSRNPTQGAANAELFSDITNGSDCVVTRTAGTPALTGTVFTSPPAPNAAAAAGLTALVASPFSVCSQLRANAATYNLLTGGTRNYAVVDGVPVSVDGNELPGSPSFKISGGVQYTFPVGNGLELTPRADAFYQNDFYTNIFNTQQDLIDGYAYVNAQVRLQPTDGPWYLRVFMQNVTNNDALTGAFDVGSGAGNFQNLFVLEPRRWGVGAGINF
jgi:outer membrane receptor protein involved in Fe transport